MSINTITVSTKRPCHQSLKSSSISVGPAAEQEYPVQLFVDKLIQCLVNPITKPKYRASSCQKCRISGIIGLNCWNEDGLDMAANHDG
jgi:hypothetical protein